MKSLHDHGPNIPVAEVMRTDIPTVSDRTVLDEALRLMNEQHRPAIAAADTNGRLVGMVTLKNLGQLMLLGFSRRAD